MEKIPFNKQLLLSISVCKLFVLRWFHCSIRKESVANEDHDIGDNAKGLISKRRFTKKTKHTRFLKKCTFFTTWYAHELFYKIVNSTVSFFAKKLACVSGGKKCSFFGKFGVLSFLVSFVLRFALWPYHTRWNSWMLLFQEVYCPVLGHYQTYMTEYFSKNS